MNFSNFSLLCSLIFLNGNLVRSSIMAFVEKSLFNEEEWINLLVKGEGALADGIGDYKDYNGDLISLTFNNNEAGKDVCSISAGDNFASYFENAQVIEGEFDRNTRILKFTYTSENQDQGVECEITDVNEGIGITYKKGVSIPAEAIFKFTCKNHS